MDRLNRVLRAQVRPQSIAAGLTAVKLPDWCEQGASLVYISRSNGQAHNVVVSACEERKQTVLIKFEADRRIWKRVPYTEVKKFGDGTLRPLWKKMEVATVPSKPSDYVEAEDEAAEEVAGCTAGPVVGPQGPPSDDEDAVVVSVPPAPAPEPTAEESSPQKAVIAPKAAIAVEPEGGRDGGMSMAEARRRCGCRNRLRPCEEEIAGTEQGERGGEGEGAREG